LNQNILTSNLFDPDLIRGSLDKRVFKPVICAFSDQFIQLIRRYIGSILPTLLVRKNEDGELDIRDILGVAFVPFQGERDE